MKKKVGILYICTWDYDIFWKDFYLSAEKYLLSDENFEKHYFVFTDKEEIFDYSVNPNIHLIAQENLWWTYATLMRFHMFNAQEKLLSQMDYLYFFNANLAIQRKIWSQEILPKKDQLFVFCQHPGFFNKSAKTFTYERNSNSLAFIPKWKGKYYIAGGLNGGKAAPYLNMCKELKNNIDEDLSKDIIAIWHDESHLNAYLYHLEESEFYLLSPEYLYPEAWKLPFEKKILIRDKTKWIDIDTIKGISFIKKFYKILQNLLCWFKNW